MVLSSHNCHHSLPPHQQSNQICAHIRGNAYVQMGMQSDSKQNCSLNSHLPANQTCKHISLLPYKIQQATNVLLLDYLHCILLSYGSSVAMGMKVVTVPPESNYHQDAVKPSLCRSVLLQIHREGTNSSTSSWMDVTEHRRIQDTVYHGEQTIEANPFC